MTRSNEKHRLVVLGNGMVGQRFLTTFFDNENAIKFDVSVIAGEKRFAYDRVGLSRYFSDATEKDLALVERQFFNENNINIYLGEQAISIDRRAKVITTDSGRCVGYDTLVIATGSHPFVPPIDGNERENCHVYRTIDDLDAIKMSASSSKVGAVIGGGLLGLEAANALKLCGLKTHVVEFSTHLMSVQLDQGGSEFLQERIEALGIDVHTKKSTKQIIDGNVYNHRLCFDDGSHLEADVIVFSAGIRPNDAIAQSAGLTIAMRGGVVIDGQCRTSDPNIFAVGEVASFDNRTYGLVAPGYTMARIASDTIHDMNPKPFTGADLSTRLKLLDIDVSSIGDATSCDEKDNYVVYSDEVAKKYFKIIFDRERKMKGAILVGDNSGFVSLHQQFSEQSQLPENPLAQLLGFDTPPVSVSESTMICSCNNVTVNDVTELMASGVVDFDIIKQSTRASTSCGGCAPLLKTVYERELVKMGQEVDKSLCEHFSFSRTELFHIVQVEKIKDFETLIKQYGNGHGCEVCKPTVASILASCWNEYVLEDELAPLQDTNDYFLANIQKNGSYSIVPRIPGGEITPDKLIVLGKVAKKYDLYTKITGGQRIDLFGAEAYQLPEIWQCLIQAGFESGHAYGKSVRTVKSCVGYTWCRYGVQDSLTQAIDIENRYKGLRSPHKIKMAVSGCTRECAEAQSKDVGIIATEKGWNLYVCGNGGMKPKHAKLFAEDLDDATLIKTIDRFLMFYIQTADRLQRTASWLDEIDGGLEYVKSVILDDHLGIGESLERQMNALVGSYQCEWKTTLSRENVLRRFSPFINEQNINPPVQYERIREQRHPVSHNVSKEVTQNINEKASNVISPHQRIEVNVLEIAVDNI